MERTVIAQSTVLRIRLILLATLAAWTCSSCVSAPPVVRPPQLDGTSSTPVLPRNAKIFGVCVHTVTNPDLEPKVLASLAGSQIMSVREDAPWKDVETSKGSYQIPAAWDKFVDGAIAQGLSPVLILDYGNKLYDGGDKPRSREAISAFARYASFVVKHFIGRVKMYEVWNEWDNNTGGFPAASPEDYGQLFAAVYPALKRIDQGATILLGSGIKKPQFYEALARSGAVANSDGISIHPYNNDSIFGPETSAELLIQLERSLVQLSGRPNVDIYVTEIGWPTNTGPNHIIETRQADFAYRTTLLMASLPFIKGLWWYDLRDDGVDPNSEEDQLGLLHNDWSAKPAWIAYNKAIAFERGKQLSLSDQSNLKLGRVIIDVTNQNGSKSSVVWNLHETKPSIYAQCIPGTGYEITSDSGKSSAPITSLTIVNLRQGTCTNSPPSPTATNGQ